MPTPAPFRPGPYGALFRVPADRRGGPPGGRRLPAALLACALLAGTAACGGDESGGGSAGTGDGGKKGDKAKFAANAGLAAGAAHQWIVKPFREGKFKKGADGRTGAMLKAGLAGGFTYNRLQAALKNARNDPDLKKAVEPIDQSVKDLKGLPQKLKDGDVNKSEVDTVQKVVDNVKEAGRKAGAEVKDNVPSLSELRG